MSGGAAGCTRGPGVALAIVTSAFSAMLLSANLATPLYAVWARQFGFSTAVLALIFAVYALVLVPALLTFGQLSDRLGRRVVIAIGLGLAALGLLLFALATGTAWLFAARATLGWRRACSAGRPPRRWPNWSRPTTRAGPRCWPRCRKPAAPPRGCC